MKMLVWLFWIVLILLVILIVVVPTKKASAEEEKAVTVTIVGGKVSDTDTVTINVADGYTISGYITKGGDRYVSRKRTDIKIDPPATKVTVQRRKAAKNVFGGNCMFGGDSEFVETLEDVKLLKLGPGETATITWKFPELESSTPPAQEQWINPRLTPPSNPIIQVFTITGVGELRQIHGHTMPCLSNSTPITISPKAAWLGGMDLYATRWGGLDGRQIEVDSIPVAVWQKGETDFDAAPTGPGEYSIAWCDEDGLRLNVPGPHPEIQITGDPVGETGKLVKFLAVWWPEEGWEWLGPISIS